MNNKTKILFFIFSLFSSFFLFAQNTWIQTYDPFGSDQVMSCFRYKMIDPNRYEEENDFIREILWEYWYDPFGADGYGVRPHMAICADGGFAVTGYYIFEDGMGGWFDWQGYVLKTDSEGNFLWADKDTLSFMGWNKSRAIVETSDGSIFNGGVGYLIKRDINGEKLWDQIIYGAIEAMCNANDGNIVITGGTQTGEFLLRKIDEDGNEIWNKDFMLGTNWTSGKCIIQTSDEGFVITGSVSDEMADSDILLIKTNADGDTLWTYRKDGCGYWDQGNWILENSENQLLCVGDILPEPLTVRGYCAKFELDGELLHEEILDPEIGYNCWYAIDIPEDNSFIITAAPYVFKCDYDFNIEWIQHWSDIFPYYRKLSDGYLMYYNGVHLIRTDSNIVSVSEDIMRESICKFTAFPNPFNPSTTISFGLLSDSKVELSVYNLKGQKVRQLVGNKFTSGQHSVVWDGTDEGNFPVGSGVYFYKLKVNGKDKSVRKCLLLK